MGRSKAADVKADSLAHIAEQLRPLAVPLASLTPDPANDVFTHPAGVKDEIRRLVGDYPVDVKNFRTHNKGWLRERFTELGVIQFEHMEDTGEEYEMFALAQGV